MRSTMHHSRCTKMPIIKPHHIHIGGLLAYFFLNYNYVLNGFNPNNEKK